MESHAEDCAADINNRLELGLSDADFHWLTKRIQREISRISADVERWESRWEAERAGCHV